MSSVGAATVRRMRRVRAVIVVGEEEEQCETQSL